MYQYFYVLTFLTMRSQEFIYLHVGKNEVIYSARAICSSQMTQRHLEKDRADILGSLSHHLLVCCRQTWTTYIETSNQACRAGPCGGGSGHAGILLCT